MSAFNGNQEECDAIIERLTQEIQEIMRENRVARAQYMTAKEIQRQVSEIGIPDSDLLEQYTAHVALLQQEFSTRFHIIEQKLKAWKEMEEYLLEITKNEEK